MQLTERNLRLLSNVARYRFRSSAQLAALDGGSAQNVLRSLRALYDHGYLDRPRAQLAVIPVEGPQAMVYGLAPKGARALREYGHHFKGRRFDREEQARRRDLHLEHTLAVADFMTALELSCRVRSDIHLIRDHDIIANAPEETRRAREPLRSTVRPERGRNELWSVVPDGLFAPIVFRWHVRILSP